MNKKFLASLLALLVILVSGCSLAKEEVYSDDMVNGDCMVGLLITEGNRGIMDHVTGEELTLEEAMAGQKVYANVDKMNSDEPADWEITFPGVEGISFIVPEFQHEDGDSFVMVVGDDEICDVKNHMNVSDEGQSREITGTVYVARAANKEYIYYLNPVYQTADGELYVTQGNGLMGSEAEGYGALGNWNVKEEKEVNVDGEKKKQGISVDVNFELMFMPTKIRVLQMDLEHHILDSKEYEPGTLPEEVKCEEKTAYVVVETERMDLDGKTITEREMCTADDEGKMLVETFSKGEFGALKKHMTTFINY